MIDWGISAIIVSIIAFGYTIYIEEFKVKKLNDKMADFEKRLESFTYTPEDIYIPEDARASYKRKPENNRFAGGVIDE